MTATNWQQVGEILEVPQAQYYSTSTVSYGRCWQFEDI
jgi:hypothetical protein